MALVQRILTRNLSRSHRLFSSGTPVCPPAPQSPIVTLLDCDSHLGLNLALLLKQSPYIRELRLFDEHANIEHIGQELSYIDTATKVKAYPPDELREAIEGAGIVLTFGGYQQETMDEEPSKMFHKNVDSVRNAALYLSEFNPDAVLCIAKSPVEALVPMAAEEYKRAQVYDPAKIIGCTAFASMVANTFIARSLNIDPNQVMCPIVGGSGPKTTVAVVSQAKPTVGFDGGALTELLDSIAQGEQSQLVVNCERNPIPLLSPAVALSNFVNLVAKGLKGMPNCVECAYVHQTGHIGEFLPYMTSIVVFGRHGVQSTHMPKLNQLETGRLREAVPHIMQNILLGQTFITGDVTMYRKFADKLKGKMEQ